MTERLYHADSFLTCFDARVLEAGGGGRRVVLDRTAFYPASGGQPADHGTLNGVAVIDVADEDERIVHVVESPLEPGASVAGVVDKARRFDHMQQHSGQHLLSAVFESLFGYATVSFHMGAESSTIELATPAVEAEQCRAAERRANEMVCRSLPVAVALEDAAGAQGLRKEASREGTLRVVTIEGVDRSACGGTHVRETGQIGPILLRKLEKMRGNVRVEFLCGGRAVARARADYEALSSVARLFTSSLEEVPALVAAQLEQVKEAEKGRRKLALELATSRGRELYEAAAPDAAGRRRHFEMRGSGALDDETRAAAQSFCSRGPAVFVAMSENPPTVLLAVSADSGLDAGNLLKSALAASGGRGGGSAQMAQGSAASIEALHAVRAALANQ